MLNQGDREYYLHRVQVELDLGDAAFDARVSATHYELATRYALLYAGRSARRPSLTLVEGGLSTTSRPVEQDVAGAVQECMA